MSMAFFSQDAPQLLHLQKHFPILFRSARIGGESSKGPWTCLAEWNHVYFQHLCLPVRRLAQFDPFAAVVFASASPGISGWRSFSLTSLPR